MLDLADRPIEEVKAFLAVRGIEAGYLVPTATGLRKSLMDAHAQLRAYLRREGLHDYVAQEKGVENKIKLRAWYIGTERVRVTGASLYRPESKNGDPRIWLTDLPTYAAEGNLLALFAYDGDIYVANVSDTNLWESATDPASPFGRLLDKFSSAKNRPIADKFSAWNLRLLKTFLSPASKGEEVFLRVDQDLLDEIGQDLGGDAGFVEALRIGPSWRRFNLKFADRARDICVQRTQFAKLKPSDHDSPKMADALLKVAGYRDPGDLDPIYRGLAAPTYLPYLAALVRVAAMPCVDGFYKQLQDSYGVKESFGSSEMERMEEIWTDLQLWTNQRNGEFGYFKLRHLGGYRWIGTPQSQSILKAGDVSKMPLIFDGAEIRPDRDFNDHLASRALSEAQEKAEHSGSFFSKTFCDALKKPEFEVPISSIMRAIYEDWDGTLPVRKSSSTGQAEEESNEPTLGLCLSIASDDPLELEVHWRLPPIYDAGSFELQHEKSSWRGSYLGSGRSFTSPNADHADEAWALLSDVSDSEITFELTSSFGEETEAATQQIRLGSHLLWILVPSFDGPEGRPCLQETSLPGYGPAYILAPPANSNRLKDYLERERPEHAVIEGSNIPIGWMLARLDNCGSLSSDQRILPDGEESHPHPRVIRLIGGRSVRRGYGTMYLPYDLPDLELDAPAGAELTWPQGVVATELQELIGGGQVESTMFRPTKRFRLALNSSNNASYRFEAVLDGKSLGQASLRVAGTEGDLVDVGSNFSLDSLGRPQATPEGLAGLLPNWDELDNTCGEAQPEDEFEVDELGVELDGEAWLPGVEEKFLDGLAQQGAMDAPTARKWIRKLLSESGRTDEPNFIMMDLRARGFIEIATTHKGNMARIHAVQPSVYALPVMLSGSRVHGVLGTLRLAHWHALATEGEAWRAYQQRGEQPFRAIRLVSKEERSINIACADGGPLASRGFRYASAPSLGIAQWSEGSDVVREVAMRNSMESIGKAAESAMRFNAAKGKFSGIPSIFPYELWKTKDLATGFDSVHYLVDRSDSGVQPGHSFVRDSRWGVWISLDAFARYMSQLPGLSGVHPVPISYESAAGVVWLPARLGLPVALERALVLCSGAAAEVLTLQTGEPQLGGERLQLRSKVGRAPRGAVSAFYFDMADGIWLAYRYVPKVVAELVAEKLGARLDII
jgi:hypothetical protein